MFEADDLDSLRRELPESRDTPVPDEQPGDPAGEPEHEALGQRLSGQPCASGTDGRAHRHLAPAPGRSGEQQVGDVHTGDQEHERDRRQQQEQSGPKAP